MRKSILIILICALFMSLAGCTNMLERDYVFTEQHVSSSDFDDPEPAVAEVSDSAQLVNILLDSISDCVAEKNVRLTDYTGDMEDDVRSAVRKVMSTPIGAYAVTNIAYQSSRILTYYEICFDITYRRTAMEIAGVVKADSIERLKNTLDDRMRQFDQRIAFLVTDYSLTKYDISSIYHDMYYSDPVCALGFDGLELNYYPEWGDQRIIELNIKYTESSVRLLNKQRMAKKTVNDIVKEYDGPSSVAKKLIYLHDALCNYASYDDTVQVSQTGGEMNSEKTSIFTAYGALVSGKATSEGYALAFKQLCGAMGIECAVVEGEEDGAEHMWNIVTIGKEMFHIDCSSDDLEDGIGYGYFGLTDEAMSQRFSWDTKLYQPCNSMLLREIVGNSCENIDESRFSETYEETVHVQTSENVNAEEEGVS